MREGSAETWCYDGHGFRFYDDNGGGEEELGEMAVECSMRYGCRRLGGERRYVGQSRLRQSLNADLFVLCSR